MPNSREEHRVKSRAATFSIAVSIGLTILKLTVGLLTNSLAILSLAVDSFFDIAGSATTLLSTRMSSRPPDREHPYGHGKIENFAGLLVTSMLLITVSYLFYESFLRILNPVPVISETIGVVGMVIGIVVEFFFSSFLLRVGRRYNSQVLEANSLQFRMDIWTQSFVIVGLFFTSLGYPIVDPITALLISVYIAYLGVNIGRKAADALLDRAPSVLFKQVEEAVEGCVEVVKYDNLRIRTAGSQTFVDLRIYVPRIFTLDKAHNIASKVERRIMKAVPGADVLVHVEAEAETEGEKAADQVRLIAANIPGIRGIHDIWVRDVEGVTEMDIHIQVDSELSLTEGHRVASKLEEQLRKEFGPTSRITTHIDVEVDRVVHQEPLVTAPEIAQAVRKIISGVEEVERCVDVSANSLDGWIHVSVTCVLKKDMTVKEAHVVAEKIENLVTNQVAGVSKVFVHTEPPAEQ
ncbi:MAG: cation-efflux pump [Thaumarchaeota archaeon]|nr:cation-efflux pump [Nitrososphaerota archaeon]MCL5317754.1 cation-efflux pump [Nitrososphaerota archaeon]